MTTPHQITDPAELVGKTIERITTFAYRFPSAGFVFTDGSFMMLDTRIDEDNGCLIGVSETPAGDWWLFGLGLITQAEFAERCAAQKRECDKQRVARELAEYDRLKAKFEGDGT